MLGLNQNTLQFLHILHKSFYLYLNDINVSFLHLHLYNDTTNINAGSFKADKIIADKTFIDVDAGNAKVGLLDSKKSEFDADVGDIKVTMAGSESDYSYEADCD